MLNLPDVTLVTIAGAAHQLTRAAIEDTLKVLKPKEVIAWTDKLDNNPLADICDELIPDCMVPPQDGLDSFGRMLWWLVPPRLKTSHCLVIQWDSWAVNPFAWTDDFLNYDYIGAVWPWYSDNMRVGNGGFSLRSKRLMQHVIDDYSNWPKFRESDLVRFPNGLAEDAIVCRLYRQKFEALGFKWAPEYVAEQFSFEYCNPCPTGTFGFHDVRNWPRVLSRNGIRNRIGLADDYVRSKPGWYELEEWLAGRAIAPWEVDKDGYIQARFGN